MNGIERRVRNMINPYSQPRPEPAWTLPALDTPRTRLPSRQRSPPGFRSRPP
jgi:hypothetical protein